MVHHDPVSVDARANGHLYVIAHPAMAREDALTALLSGQTTPLIDAVKRAVRARPATRSGSFSPDLGGVHWVRRSGGLTSISGINDASQQVTEDRLLELSVLENGAVTILCGRAVSAYRPSWYGAEGQPEFRAVSPAMILGLVHGTLALAADLAERHAAYQGQWQIGLRITGLRGAYAGDIVQAADTDMVRAYDREVYERLISSTTIEMADEPVAMTERLVGPLLRGLAIEHLYLPYGQQQTV